MEFGPLGVVLMDRSSDVLVLLVEDNPDDVLITQRAWKKASIKNRLFVLNDGEAALKYLKKEEEYSKVSAPGLVLLDLKMPGVNGFDVLKVIKAEATLRRIPIIVLTSSDNKQDIDLAYRLGCNSYIVKPVGFENLLKAVTEIKDYWLEISKIP